MVDYMIQEKENEKSDSSLKGSNKVSGKDIYNIKKRI